MLCGFLSVLFVLKMVNSTRRGKGSGRGKGKESSSKGGDGTPTALPLTELRVLAAGIPVLESSHPTDDWGGPKMTGSSGEKSRRELWWWMPRQERCYEERDGEVNIQDR